MIFEVYVYSTKNGVSEINEWLEELGERDDQRSKALIKKIRFQVDLLRKRGFLLNEPYSKKLENNLFELRPVPERIIYGAFDGNCFVLLHHFRKKTNKTPKQEITKAKKELADWLERNGNNEKSN